MWSVPVHTGSFSSLFELRNRTETVPSSHLLNQICRVMSTVDVDPFDWDARSSQVGNSVASDSASHVASSVAGSAVDVDELESADLDILSKPTKKVLSRVVTSASKTGPLTYTRLRGLLDDRVEELMDVDGSCYDPSVMPDRVPLEAQDDVAVDNDTPLTVSECLLAVAIVLARLHVERHRNYEAKMARLDTQAQQAVAADDSTALNTAEALDQLAARPFTSAASLRDAWARPHLYWPGVSPVPESWRALAIVALAVVAAWVLPMAVVVHMEPELADARLLDARTRAVLARAHVDVLDRAVADFGSASWESVAAAGTSARASVHNQTNALERRILEGASHGVACTAVFSSVAAAASALAVETSLISPAS